MLLGATPDDRRGIYQVLKKAYGERSTIVHGGAPDAVMRISGEDIPFAAFVERVEEYLRQAIKAFLRRSYRHSEKKVLDDLDEQILTGQFPEESPE